MNIREDQALGGRGSLDSLGSFGSLSRPQGGLLAESRNPEPPVFRWTPWLGLSALKFGAEREADVQSQAPELPAGR